MRRRAWRSDGREGGEGGQRTMMTDGGEKRRRPGVRVVVCGDKREA